MLLSDTFSTALKGVTGNTSRSLLTMLGIIIGVGSVVLMSAIGASMKGVILSQISSLGARSMVIFPGKQEGGAQAVSTGHDSLTFDDLDALEKLSTIETLAPVIFVPGTVTYGREEGSPQVLGVVREFFLNQKISANVGRLIDQTDEEGAKAVAVIGPDVVDKFFGNNDPLGQKVQIGDRSYTVIGLSNPLGSQFFQNADNRIYVPFSVAREVTGQPFINYITMQSTVDPDLALKDVQLLLRQRHHIDNPDDDEKEDDFVVRTSGQANDILSSVSVGLTAFITTIATISLIVGGIGIMNIMLVAVTERTREIGLRKAVGATKFNILLQFLTESVMFTVIGGLIGMIIGVGLAWLASLAVTPFLNSYAFALSPVAMIVAFVMAAATGIVFGISPARKAANLHPIEALRYE